MRELKSPKVCDCTNLAAQEHIHQISVFPVNDWSGGAQAGHLENISLERRGPLWTEGVVAGGVLKLF